MAGLSNTEKAKLEDIKNHFDEVLENKEEEGITIQDAVRSIKKVMEESIIELGEAGKTALIRSQKPIKMIHETVKSSFIRNDIDPDLITPPLGQSSGELKLAGLLKQKNQDICILPKDEKPKVEILKIGLLKGVKDPYGSNYTEKILSVNVRSQLSSLGNNIDTLYERAYAETMNLHMRCNKMVLGEVYMIPVYEYDKHKAQNHEIGWLTKQSPVDIYLKAYQALNGRDNTDKDFYKYEKVCLLVVDFSQEDPKIYNSDDELKEDGLLPDDTDASISELTWETFTSSLLKEYQTRFGN